MLLFAALLIAPCFAQEVPLTPPDAQVLNEARALNCSPSNPCLLGISKHRVAYVVSHSLAGGNLPNGTLLLSSTTITSSTPLYRRSALVNAAEELRCPEVKLDKQDKAIPPPENEPHCHITFHTGINGVELMVQILRHDPKKNSEGHPPDHIFWELRPDGSAHKRMCICHGPI